MFNDIKITEPSYWSFLYEEPNNGWWLKIDNCNDLVNYHLKTSNIYNRCISDYLHNAEKYEETGRYDCFNSPRTYAIVRYAEDNSLTFLDACIQFRMMVAERQSEAIHQFGYIVINKVGGFHSGPIKYSQFVHRKNFIWPDFKESDIRISQFEGGTHWYVYIGDMELHEEDNIKWMSKEDAKRAAMRYVNKEII